VGEKIEEEEDEEVEEEEHPAETGGRCFVIRF